MKKIKNFSSLLVNNNSTIQHFELSSAMFIFPRKVISSAYGDFPDDNTFKIYIYLNRECSIERIGINKYGDIFVGKDKIVRELAMTQYSVDHAIDWLEQNFFVLKTGTKKGKADLRKVLIAPDYDELSHNYIGLSNIDREVQQMKNFNAGFIKLPKEVLNNTVLSNSSTTLRRFLPTRPIWRQAHWDTRKLKILIQLYSHCWFKYYGGIDPSVISITYDHNTNVAVLQASASFCATLQENNAEIERTIEFFIRAGLLKIVQVSYLNTGFGEVRYEKDLQSSTQLGPKEKARFVLRPKFMIGQDMTEHLQKGEVIE